MIIYKHKQVDIKKKNSIYIVHPDLTSSLSGVYIMYDVEPNSIYKVRLDHGNFHGNIKLWIATDKNKVIEFSNELSLSKIRKRMDLCFNVGDTNKIKIGLLFDKPKKDEYFELESIDIKKVNVANSKKRLAIIVPYRDRMEHLKTFVPFMNDYLKNFDSQIFIIHQNNNKLFNRASLFNIGFDIVKNHFDYFCFHDIDLIAEASDYSYPDEPAHLSMYCSQHNYKRISMFGGVVLFTKDQFEKINGFSNKYQGWGGEDNDLRLRVKQYYRPEYRPGKYTSLVHKHNGSNHEHYKQNVKLYKERSKDIKLLKNEGLYDLGRSFKYKILKNKLIDDECTIKDIDKIKYKNKVNFMIDVDF